MSSQPRSRSFAVGDVHGCDVALDVLLERMQLTGADRVIFLGDLIDRGPDSRRVIEMVLQTGRSCRCDVILGNHEEMLLEALDDPRSVRFWLECGGDAALESYGGRLEDIPDEHLALLRTAVPYIETDSDILVHANLEPGVPLDEQTAEWLRWNKFTGWERPHPSGKRVICGHTQMPDGIPHTANGWVTLDTSAYRGGFLTALDLESGEILQATQGGAFRGGVHLDEL
jgi:serine/threonine protein phosphatase 1